MTQDPRRKVIILVKHGLYDPWIEIAQSGQETTWLTTAKKLGIQVVHFYGKPARGFFARLDKWHEKLRLAPKVHVALAMIDWILLSPLLLWIPKTTLSRNLAVYGDQIEVAVPDIILLLRWKQLSAYRHLLSNYQFDFCYETNASSYIQVENLVRYVDQLEFGDTYQGNLIGWEKFVSGANRLWSSSMLTKVLSNRIFWSPAALEDVALGRLARKLKIEARPTKSIQITLESEIPQISEMDLRSVFHFRMKSIREGRRIDPLLMKELHNRYNRDASLSD